MLATLAQLKAALGISGTDQDALLTSALEQANGLIAGYIGADLSDTTERLETVFVPDGATYAHLNVWPVIEVNTLTANGSPVTEYSASLRSGALFFDYLPGTAGRMGNEVLVAYRAGFAIVPADLQTVALNIASSIYNNGGVLGGAVATGESALKSLTMFDAMSMSFDTTPASATTPDALLKTWSFLLDKYRLNTPVMK
jgi:hypothetical protein